MKASDLLDPEKVEEMENIGVIPPAEVLEDDEEKWDEEPDEEEENPFEL